VVSLGRIHGDKEPGPRRWSTISTPGGETRVRVAKRPHDEPLHSHVQLRRSVRHWAGSGTVVIVGDLQYAPRGHLGTATGIPACAAGPTRHRPLVQLDHVLTGPGDTSIAAGGCRGVGSDQCRSGCSSGGN